MSGYALEATSDGVAVVGRSYGSFTTTIARLDAGGAVVWSREIPITPGTMTRALDDGLVLAGSVVEPTTTDTDVAIVKVDVNGAAVWQRTWGVAGPQFPASIVTLGDGSFVVAVNASAGGVSEGWLARVNADGDLLWMRGYGPGNLFAEVVATAEGGLFVVGSRPPVSGQGTDLYAMKADDSGAVQWERRIVDGAGALLGARSVVQTPDGGFAIAGDTPVGIDASTSWVVKLDASGSASWGRLLDVATLTYHFAGDIVALPDGSLLLRESRRLPTVHGPFRMDGRVWKLASDGTPLAIAAMGQGRALVRKGSVVFTSDAPTPLPGPGETPDWLVQLDLPPATGCASFSPLVPTTQSTTLVSAPVAPTVSTLSLSPSASPVSVAVNALVSTSICGTPPLLGAPGLYDPAASTFHLRPGLASGAAAWDPLESTCRHASLSIL